MSHTALLEACKESGNKKVFPSAYDPSHTFAMQLRELASELDILVSLFPAGPSWSSVLRSKADDIQAAISKAEGEA